MILWEYLRKTIPAMHLSILLFLCSLCATATTLEVPERELPSAFYQKLRGNVHQLGRTIVESGKKFGAMVQQWIVSSIVKEDSRGNLEEESLRPSTLLAPLEAERTTEHSLSKNPKRPNVFFTDLADLADEKSTSLSKILQDLNAVKMPPNRLEDLLPEEPFQDQTRKS